MVRLPARAGRPGPDRVLVFQEFDQLLPWKTVRENVLFALTAQSKVATVTLRLPAEVSGATVELDGKALSSSVLGVPIPLNPGKHRLSAAARVAAASRCTIFTRMPTASDGTWSSAEYSKAVHPASRSYAS